MLAVYQKDFINTAIRVQALKFGEFNLKSGRISPYFFNAGAFADGDALWAIARAYASRIVAMLEQGMAIEVLFGPAYKGIPLVAATSVILAQSHGINLPWAFNRKEAKDHGEGGVLVGASVTDKQVLILDDVLTAGTAIRESLALLAQHQARPCAVLVALDRQECLSDNDPRSALQAVGEDSALPTDAVLSLSDLMRFISEDESLKQYLPAMDAYRQRYGSA
ncbi:orotate phosphoribosyltransferase [Suttonella sp. R2A3]|uniref:orotate phosphoribosyltransferase n=1 Tax=Suttonella sp. R2A3 TaxID=2908648 RepID=UPI001F464D12|nr:orotate phosphoribosyltransferase [Suttonella sp. R2A3]UJF23876.1 orotate phosphoribosyltransferase [Suttonella sp. R2A3]